MKKSISLFLSLISLFISLSIPLSAQAAELWLDRSTACNQNFFLPSGNFSVTQTPNHKNVQPTLQSLEFIAREQMLILNNNNYTQLRSLFTQDTTNFKIDSTNSVAIEDVIKSYQEQKSITSDGKVGDQTSYTLGKDIGVICNTPENSNNTNSSFIDAPTPWWNLENICSADLDITTLPDVSVVIGKEKNINEAPTYFKIIEVLTRNKVLSFQNKSAETLQTLFVRKGDIQVLLKSSGDKQENQSDILDLIKEMQQSFSITVDGYIGTQSRAALSKAQQDFCAQFANNDVTDNDTLNGDNNDDSNSELYLIPDNPGILDWSSIGGGRKGEAVAKGLAFKILDFFLGFVAIIAVIMLIYAGFLYITAAGEDDQQTKATSIIKWGAAGLLLVMLAESIVKIIFPTQGDIRDIDSQGSQLDTSKVLNTNAEGIDLVTSIINWVLGFLSVIVVVMLIYGGFLYLTAAGDGDQQSKATKLIIQAIIGIVVILSAFAIVNILIGGIASLV